MNVAAAPFLYACKSEVQAFALYRVFIHHNCPLYVQNTLKGVHRGLKLLNICLEKVDARLYNHLHAKGLTAEIYAFASVMTFSACTPPLNEVLILWDFLLAYGVHLNILCIIAQLLFLRDEILQSSNPNKVLRTFPPLKARLIIGISVSLIKKIPHDIYNLLCKHPWSESAGKLIDEM